MSSGDAAAGGLVGDEEERRAAVASLGGGEAALSLVIHALGDESWRVRKEAVARAAAWAEPERAIAMLAETLAEPENVGRRNAAVEALVLVGAQAVPALLAGLAQRPDLRKLHADALGLIGDRRAAPALAHALDDGDPNVRAAAAEALGRLGGDEASAALQSALHGALDRGELLLSLACLEALNWMGAALPLGRLAPLLEMLVLRPATLAAIGHTADPAAAPILVAHLADRSRGVREAAVSALDRLCESIDEGARATVERAVAAMPEAAQPTLIRALLEGSPAVRRSAAAVLGLSGRASVVRPLVVALGDPQVQDAAVAALVRIGPIGSAELAATAAELDADLRADVFRLLPHLATTPTAALHWIALLLDGLADDEDRLAGEAARALGEIGGDEALEPLLAALGRPALAATAARALARLAGRLRDPVRARVIALGFVGEAAPYLCRVLGSCGRPDDAPILVGLLLHDERAEVRAAAAESLGAIGRGPADRSVEETLCIGLVDEAPEVRLAAARALASFPSSRVAAALHGAGADGAPAVRLAAVKSLAAQLSSSTESAPKTGAAGPLGALVGLIASPHPHVAVVAIDALGRSGLVAAGSAEATALLGALERNDSETVKAAVHALSRLTPTSSAGSREIEAGVLRALAHPRWDVRAAAAAALGTRTDAATVAALRDRLAVESDPIARDAIAAALSSRPDQGG